jgi:hypothetical protein
MRNTRIYNFYHANYQNSFLLILVVAFLVRLLAVFFSEGYGMHDDHFLIIEAASSWADGYDYNFWLPWTDGNKGIPEGHSFSYVGLNYFYFALMKWIGVMDPKILMLFNRAIHAALSLIVVAYGMKITEKLSSQKNAITVGWFLALLWLFPFVSVRNLVEVAAIPFLILGVWLLIDKKKYSYIFTAGLLIGLAVSFRYQIGIFAIGLGLYYVIKNEFKTASIFSLGVVIMFTITQGIVDLLIWGYPFAEFWSYVNYNLTEGTTYLPNQNYLMYVLVLTGVFLLPLGVLLFIGFIKSYKNYLIIFIPTALFIIFHTIYPNRQERFILSILPFFIILGVIGYDLLKNTKWKIKLWKVGLYVFWIFNSLLLCFSVSMYSKKSRVEAMYSLYNNKMEKEIILMEGSASGKVSMLPKFYAKSWDCFIAERLKESDDLNAYTGKKFDYIFFYDDAKLSERISSYKKIYPKMELHFQANPSFLDRLLRTLNPRNSNEYIEVWKTNARK